MSAMKDLLYERETTAFTIAEQQQEIRRLSICLDAKQKQVRALMQQITSIEMQP